MLPPPPTEHLSMEGAVCQPCCTQLCTHLPASRLEFVTLVTLVTLLPVPLGAAPQQSHRNLAEVVRLLQGQPPRPSNSHGGGDSVTVVTIVTIPPTAILPIHPLPQHLPAAVQIFSAVFKARGRTGKG